MELDDHLQVYRELREAGRHEEAAANAETFIWQLVAAGRQSEALEIIAETIENSKSAATLCQSWSTVGNLLYERKLFDRARAAYLTSLGFCTSTDEIEQARIRFSIGNTYLMEENMEQASVLYEESLAISERCQFTAGIADNSIQLTDVLKYLNRVDDARSLAQRALIASIATGKEDKLKRAVTVSCNLILWFKGLGREELAHQLLAYVRKIVPESAAPEIRAIILDTERQLAAD